MKLAVVAALLAICTPPASSTIDRLAGTYRQTKTIEMVVHPPEKATDELRIVKAGPDIAFVDFDLHFYNGHACGLVGVFRAEGDALVYRDPGEVEKKRCVLKIRRSKDRIVFHEDGVACELLTCGTRGRYSGVSLPVASRRPVLNPDDTLNSYTFRLALEDYRRLGQ